MSTIAAVRAQLALQILATTSLRIQSAETIESIRDPSHSPVHLEFAVGSESEGYAGRNGQERTRITVIAAYQLPPKDRVVGYDAALVLERALLAGLQVSDWGALSPRLAALCDFASRREPGIDGWLWLTVTLLALHPTL